MSKLTSDQLEDFCRGALDQPGIGVGTVAAIILGSVITYIFIAGIVHRLATDKQDGMIGGFWPFTLPFLLGTALVNFITRPRVPSARVVERKDVTK